MYECWPAARDYHSADECPPYWVLLSALGQNRRSSYSIDNIEDEDAQPLARRAGGATFY